MNNINSNGLYRTTDFYLACFLKVKGVKLIKAVGEPNKIKSVIFMFEPVENLEQLINGFFNDSETVTANRFVNAIRDLKALSHTVIDEENQKVIKANYMR
jgi:hypothetical protein